MGLSGEGAVVVRTLVPVQDPALMQLGRSIAFTNTFVTETLLA